MVAYFCICFNNLLPKNARYRQHTYSTYIYNVCFSVICTCYTCPRRQMQLSCSPAAAASFTSSSCLVHQQQLLRSPAAAVLFTSSSCLVHQQKLSCSPAAAVFFNSSSFLNHQHQLSRSPAAAVLFTSNSCLVHQQLLIHHFFYKLWQQKPVQQLGRVGKV